MSTKYTYDFARLGMIAKLQNLGVDPTIQDRVKRIVNTLYDTLAYIISIVR